MAGEETNTRTNLGQMKVAFVSVNDVVDGLRHIRDWEGENLEKLREATERLLVALGYQGETEITNEVAREKILDFLVNIDDNLKIEEAEQEAEESESKALSSQELEQLLADYEKAKGERQERIAREVMRRTGVPVSEIIEIKKQIYQANVTEAKEGGVEEKKWEEVSTKLACVKVYLIEKGTDGQAAEEVTTVMAKELARENATLATIEEKTKNLVTAEEGELTDIWAQMRMRVQANRISPVWEEKIIEGWQSGEIALEGAETDLEIKKAEVAAREMMEREGEIIERAKMVELRERIVTEVTTINQDVNRETAEDYANFVVEVYKNNPVARYRNEARMEAEAEGISPGQFDNAFRKTEVVWKVLKTRDVGEMIARYRQIKARLERLPEQIDYCRAVNEVMVNMDMGEMMTARRMINFKPVDWVMRLTGRVREGVMGVQNLSSFVKNTTSILAQGKNLGESLGLIFKSIIGGAKVAGAGAAAGTGAGAGLAIASGPAAPVVAVALAAAKLINKVIRPIVGKIKQLADKLGISLGINKFLKEKIGGIPGTILSWGVNAGMILIGGLGVVTAAAFASALALIGPVILFVFVGILGYQMFQSSQISSVVPPIAIGGGEEMFLEQGEQVVLTPLPDWDTSLPLPESCPRGFPVEGGTITQGWAAPNCSHKNMANAVDVALGTGSRIMATHEGVARAGADRIYGNFVELRAKCDGVEFVTRYAHLLELPDYKGDVIVSKGQTIGMVDNTGSSTGPHIHYDLRGSLPKSIEYYLGMPENSLKGCCNAGPNKCRQR